MRRLLMICAIAVLGACGQPTSPAETPATTETAQPAPQTAAEATAQDTCGAAQYSSLVGANIAAVTLPAGPNIRVIQPDSMVTQDFKADRLNIIVDNAGVITSLECY
jgi:hypothetical protein